MIMPELTEGFHEYGLLWTPEEYVFYVDGKEVWRTQAGGVSQVRRLGCADETVKALRR